MINQMITKQKRPQSLFRYSVLLCTLWLSLSAIGCERYQQKQAARERRLDYLRSVIDSSRVAHDARNDSLRRVAADSIKTDSVKKAQSQGVKQ